MTNGSVDRRLPFSQHALSFALPLAFAFKGPFPLPLFSTFSFLLSFHHPSSLFTHCDLNASSSTSTSFTTSSAHHACLHPQVQLSP